MVVPVRMVGAMELHRNCGASLVFLDEGEPAHAARWHGFDIQDVLVVLNRMEPALHPAKRIVRIGPGGLEEHVGVAGDGLADILGQRFDGRVVPEGKTFSGVRRAAIGALLCHHHAGQLSAGLLPVPRVDRQGERGVRPVFGRHIFAGAAPPAALLPQ